MPKAIFSAIVPSNRNIFWGISYSCRIVEAYLSIKNYPSSILNTKNSTVKTTFIRRYLSLYWSQKQLRSRLPKKLKLRSVSPIKTEVMQGIFLLDEIDRRQSIEVQGWVTPKPRTKMLKNAVGDQQKRNCNRLKPP